MTPRRLHAPLEPAIAVGPLVSATGGARRSNPTVISCPLAKKPMADPSGFQNGASAPSVPEMASAWSVSMSDTDSDERPKGVNATRRPSGDTEKLGPKLAPWGGSRTNSLTVVPVGGAPARPAMRAPTAKARSINDSTASGRSQPADETT